MFVLSSARSALRRALAGLCLAVLVVTTVVIGGSTPAGACSCSGEPLADYVDQVSAAFVGRQVDRADDPTGQVALTFEVERVYVGELEAVVIARTESDEGACGIDFGGQGEVAVAAYGDGDGLQVDLCTSPVGEEELAEVFGAAVDPLPASEVTSVDDVAEEEDEADVPEDDGAEDGDGGSFPSFTVLAILTVLFLSGVLLVVFGVSQLRSQPRRQ